jgi:hypothetical protein
MNSMKLTLEQYFSFLKSYHMDHFFVSMVNYSHYSPKNKNPKEMKTILGILVFLLVIEHQL